MAFKVQHGGVGYIIILGDRKRGGYQARDLDEVKKALEHYLAAPYHNSAQQGCPLCRAMDREEKENGQ